MLGDFVAAFLLASTCASGAAAEERVAGLLPLRLVSASFALAMRAAVGSSSVLSPRDPFVSLIVALLRSLMAFALKDAFVLITEADAKSFLTWAVFAPSASTAKSS
eukprot:Blabericola_migrator_1__999@NODE_1251_length_4978_cov_149_408267_g845_i0_p6_GENE_NODE_1251_length_4978_cov_149_408267_g845_i0NODE_1251_length_4978_cov_149_408267_g845_i0_p6_ORF_typecomplete_len106_score18_55DUF4556/PF15094_6/0_053_NODE_1251_length_4978_cov_149_408267_g845_i0581898